MASRPGMGQGRRATRPQRRSLLAAVGAAVLLASAASRAQAPSASAPAASAPAAPGSAAAAPDDGKLAEAKELFRKGVVLLQAGEVERALDAFLQSRLRFPSVQNTTNAAVCLDRLGRFDEALELYEEILVQFAQQLDADDRASIQPAMERLRGEVGTLELSANVGGGAVLIDGRQRGKLPLSAPVRVRAGRRQVRVLKDGYQTFEQVIEVPRGERRRLDAKLEPLAQAGQVRVEDPGNEGSEVFVDGARVGESPWEGTLGVGRHLVWTRKGELGSAPVELRVVQGVTVLLRARSAALGAPARLRVTPATAALAVDGVEVAVGQWEGRLPVGTHQISAEEAGYFRRAEELRVGAEGEAAATVLLRLSVDESHPRWPRPLRGYFWAGVLGGAALGRSMGSQAEASCPGSCTSDPVVSGGVGVARFGYLFPIGIEVGLGAGYLAVGTSLTRGVNGSFEPEDGRRVQVQYRADDQLRLRGGVAVVSLGYQHPMSERVRLSARASGGVLLASARDALRARAYTAATPEGTPAYVDGAGKTASSTAPLLAIELGVLTRVKGVDVGGGLAMLGVLTSGGPLPHGTVEIERNCTRDKLGAAGCAPASDRLKQERSFSPFVLWVPQLQAAYTF